MPSPVERREHAFCTGFSKEIAAWRLSQDILLVTVAMIHGSQGETAMRDPKVVRYPLPPYRAR